MVERLALMPASGHPHASQALYFHPAAVFGPPGNNHPAAPAAQLPTLMGPPTVGLPTLLGLHPARRLSSVRDTLAALVTRLHARAAGQQQDAVRHRAKAQERQAKQRKCAMAAAELRGQGLRLGQAGHSQAPADVGAQADTLQASTDPGPMLTPTPTLALALTPSLTLSPTLALAHTPTLTLAHMPTPTLALTLTPTLASGPAGTRPALRAPGAGGRLRSATAQLRQPLHPRYSRRAGGRAAQDG